MTIQDLKKNRKTIINHIDNHYFDYDKKEIMNQIKKMCGYRPYENITDWEWLVDDVVELNEIKSNYDKKLDNAPDIEELFRKQSHNLMRHI